MPYTQDGVPFSAPGTSYAAAESISSVVETMKATILRLLHQSGAAGMTCDELEVALDWRHQTVSARLRDLVAAQQIRITAQRRPTRSGRGAWVYVTVSP